MILVVGGTGFIGKNLLAALSLLRRAATSASRTPDHGFIAAHAAGCTAMTMEEIYADPGVLARFDAVVWLGGGIGPAQNLDTPWLEMSTTVEPVLRMAHALLAHNPLAHFIFLSSGGTVYGNAGQELVDEEAPLKPISPYGFGKVMCEKAIMLLADTKGLRTTILRPSNPVGPWQLGRQQGVVGALLNCIETGAGFPVMGDGEAVRDYFDARDLARAILAVIDTPDRAVGRIYNAGSGRGVSVNEIVALVCRITGHPLEIIRHPPRAADVRRIVLDPSRIRAELGWVAEVPLEQSIRDMAVARNMAVTG